MCARNQRLSSEPSDLADWVVFAESLVLECSYNVGRSQNRLCRHPDQPACGLLAAGGLLFRSVFALCTLAMPDDLWFGIFVCQGNFLWVIHEGNNSMTTLS